MVVCIGSSVSCSLFTPRFQCCCCPLFFFQLIVMFFFLVNLQLLCCCLFEVVRRHTSRTAQRGTLYKGEVNCHSSRSSVNLEIQGIGQQWLKGAWIGRLKNMAMFDRVEEYLWWYICLFSGVLQLFYSLLFPVGPRGSFDLSPS